MFTDGPVAAADGYAARIVSTTNELVLKQKPITRLAAAAAVVVAALWLDDDRTPQAAVGLAIALALFASSLRAVIVVRDDTVYRRGLLGWDREPLLLEHLTAISLRRQFQSRRVVLQLKLTAAATGGDELSTDLGIECWAWRNWRELAHRAGHFARALDASRDDVTDERTACTRPWCPWELYVTDRVAGRHADPPASALALAPAKSELSVLGAVGTLAGLFAVGAALGLFVGWFRDDPEIGPLLPVALASGGFFVVAGVLNELWEKLKS